MVSTRNYIKFTHDVRSHALKTTLVFVFHTVKNYLQKHKHGFIEPVLHACRAELQQKLTVAVSHVEVEVRTFGFYLDGEGIVPGNGKACVFGLIIGKQAPIAQIPFA